jgi:hypothetical protein
MGQEELLLIAVHLKEAATRAGRLDVAAKADEAIILIAGAGADTDEPADRGNTVLRILNGLGF